MKNFEHIKLAKQSLAGIPKPESQLTYRGVPLYEFTAEEVDKIVEKIWSSEHPKWTIPDQKKYEVKGLDYLLDNFQKGVYDFPYKPWDRVQLVEADVEGYTTRCNSVNEHAGELATIVRYSGKKWYTVELDSNGKVLTVHLDHLASTTKLKPAFRVGDSVIISGFSTMFNGVVGVVTEVKHHTGTPRYSVKLCTVNGTCGFDGRYLEPAPQTDNSFIRSEN